MAKITKKFRIADTTQQMVGAILLSGPFIVTEEVWRMGENLQLWQFIMIILFNFVVGYFALFKADKTRNPDVEQSILGIPLRLVSLIGVGYLSLITLVILFSPQNTFGIDFIGTVFSITICSTFSIVGAATADSVF